jgi:hypothetical protein
VVDAHQLLVPAQVLGLHIFENSACADMPALLMSASMRPKRATAAVDQRAALGGSSATSVRTTSACAPAAAALRCHRLQSLLVARGQHQRRPDLWLAASWRAISAPMPSEAHR